MHLAQAGHYIVLGSRRERERAEWLPEAEIEQMIWQDTESLIHCCSGADIVIHTAGMNAQDCFADPVGALEFNGVATARLVSAASRAGVKGFVYLSTAHVYASPLEGIISEETCPRNLHPYATSHLAGENAVLEAAHSGQIDVLVLRLSNAFGVPTHKAVNCWMLLVNDLCKQAIQNRKMVLRSSGIQKRDFISLSCLCVLIEQLIDKYKISGIVNIGSGVSRSILDMAYLVQNRCSVLLGYDPLLIRCEKNAEMYRELKYMSKSFDLIEKSLLSNDYNSEIDNLLRYCHYNF